MMSGGAAICRPGRPEGRVVVCCGRASRDGLASIRLEKGGFKTEVHIAICPELAKSIAATPHCESAFISSAHGRPYTKNSLGNNFHDWCVEAGLDGFSAHGLRKSSSNEAAEAGATEHELMAMRGWSDPRTAAIYTKKVNRKKLALRGQAKVEAERKIPHPPAP